MLDITQIIANELNVNVSQVAAATKLLDEGDTVPFIARYRKEATGGLSDTDLRTLEERLQYLRELNERKITIIASIKEQGKLTDELEKDINSADTKARLEDLYKPFKVKRRTKGQIAIEAGLKPLADQILLDPSTDPELEALKYIDSEKSINDVKAALEGARYILMEQFADDANLVGTLRDLMWDNGVLTSAVIKEKEEAGVKYKDYFAFQETIKTIPSHRALALLRGRKEEFLDLNIVLDADCIAIVAKHFLIADQNRLADKWLLDVCKWTWQIKLKTSLELEIISTLREKSEEEAIKVFAKNLNDLLMAPPAGQKNTLGLDPGLRTGVKLAIVDATGKFLEQAVIYPHAPHNKWQESIAILAALCERHTVSLVGIGNGTASRETESLVNDLIKQYPKLQLVKMVVSEAGASVYSASQLASTEFPNIDVSIRGAISIARRLQDPLAELVKVEPKAIGVGQYQHDVSQIKLAKSLDAVVEDCVNKVGVDLNTASAPLLGRVAGLSNLIAQNIVEYREKNGAFTEREELKNVSRLKGKAFEQCAGFLRISNGKNPLDASSVHPEAYPIVNKILTKFNKDIKTIIGDLSFLKQLKPSEFVDEQFGIPTIQDIINELEKPGRDPRAQFRTVQYKEGVAQISDLKKDMILEGVVTNVANFGAFIDLGVHQDGLVHVSELADKFVKDPREIVKVGDIVTVKVLEIDVARKRIGLTLRLHAKADANSNSNYSPNSTTYGSKSSKEYSAQASKNGYSQNRDGAKDYARDRVKEEYDNTNRSSSNNSQHKHKNNLSAPAKAMNTVFADALKDAFKSKT